MLMRFPGHWLPHIAGWALCGQTGETFLSIGGHNMAEARKVFEQEIANVEQQIRVLRQRREHLRALLGTYSQPASSPAAAAPTGTANGRSPQKQSPTSSEMARQI